MNSETKGGGTDNRSSRLASEVGSEEQQMLPCEACKQRLGNDGIPSFYDSTVSDFDSGVYPARVKCEQCGLEVRCGENRHSAVHEWNREMIARKAHPASYGEQEVHARCDHCGKGIYRQPDGVWVHESDDDYNCGDMGGENYCTAWPEGADGETQFWSDYNASRNKPPVPVASDGRGEQPKSEWTPEQIANAEYRADQRFRRLWKPGVVRYEDAKHDALVDAELEIMALLKPTPQSQTGGEQDKNVLRDGLKQVQRLVQQIPFQHRTANEDAVLLTVEGCLMEYYGITKQDIAETMPERNH